LRNLAPSLNLSKLIPYDSYDMSHSKFPIEGANSPTLFSESFDEYL